MSSVEVVLGVLVVATVLAWAARRANLPEPIVLVLAGLVLGAVPGMPGIELDPDLVFLLFLPPILYAAGYFTSIRDFKANLRPILLLSVGLVIVTALAVAVVLRALVPDLPWPAAVAFWAIVAPPDAVAATAVFRRLGVPRQLVTILEGESLVNDATALVTLRMALIALAGGFSIVDAASSFLVVAAGGVLVGLVVARLAGIVLTRVQDATLGIVISLLVPVVAYVPAEALGVSGVLAVVVAGIDAGRISARSLNSAQRVDGLAAWRVVLFLINGLVFMLIGLQLPVIVADLDGSMGALAPLAAAVSVTVIGVRIAWVFPAIYLPRLLSGRIREREPALRPGHVLIVAWAGMRGVVSLAAALSLPIDFPQRSLVQFLTFVVILVTLVGQGLTLPALIRALKVRGTDAGLEEEERSARLAAATAAVARIDALRGEWPEHLELLDQLHVQYEHRVSHIEPEDGIQPDDAERELLEHRLIRRAVIDAEREAMIGLRDEGRLSDQAMRRLERDLDLEELRLEA